MQSDDRQFNLPKREEKILEFWERNEIFKKTLAKTRRAKRSFIFYEGPPYANGLPGIHHFEARVFKDIIIRHRTMRGFFAPRKAGWDTHGLPVEMQVEKKLGVTTKKDIEEKIGIEKFVTEARNNVFFYKAEWERFTRRIGYWLDFERAYMTMSTEYIESLWRIIKEIWKYGLLYEDFKVVPWCPRCETPLSTHELGLGYRMVKDRSVYIRFRLKNKEPRWNRASILSWTTTPWTIPGNTALAINPKEDYVLIPDPEVKGQWIILGQKRFRDLVEKHLFPPEYRSSLMLDDIETFKGKELVGLEYEPLFPVAELASEASHRIYPADFVTMDEGTGVVHIAPMYGEDDYRIGKRFGLPMFHTVDGSGRFIASAGGGLEGKFAKDPKTEEEIIASLRERDAVFKEEHYEHDYPFCWRCETPVLYYARSAWWVKMSAVKQKLIANNRKVNWIPAHLKEGRFGEFLKDVRDWAFSRERYWGTPLPVWRCAKCGGDEVVGSTDELERLSGKRPENRYILMRHGRADSSQRKFISADLATEAGKSRLLPAARKEIARIAAEIGRRHAIGAIYSSDFARTRETAEIVRSRTGAGIIFDPRLREMNHGIFEGRPVADFEHAFASVRERFVKAVPGGETLEEVRARMFAVIRDLESKFSGKTFLIVSHGDPLWMLEAAMRGLDIGGAIDLLDGSYFVPGGWREVPLRMLPREPSGAVNLHRPFVDEFALKCRKCAGVMRRIPDVADVWFDSGAMPFAQHHYPFEHKKDLPYPADYICEGVDQTRGWFYTLLAVATALKKAAPYKNVISVGHVLDKNNQKMSKSKGNVVDPMLMIEKYGTDAIRWYFFTINAPGDPKRFDENDLLIKMRGALSTLWNSFVFFDTYVEKIRNSKSKARPSQNILDRWMEAKLDAVTEEAGARLDDYDVVGAARLLDAFITDDFSNWYLRRSRRRFQRPADEKEKDLAAAALGGALLRLAELMAPFTPFLAEIVYQELRKKTALKEESVHLRAWPAAKRKGKSGGEFMAEMSEIRRLSALALAERAKAGIKVRQPLAKLQIPNAKLQKIAGLADLIKDEVNVKEIIFGKELKLDTAISEELREEGLAREIVRNIQEMRRDGEFKPRHRVRLGAAGDPAAEAIIRRWQKFIMAEAGVSDVQYHGKKDGFAVEREAVFDGGIIRLGIRKA